MAENETQGTAGSDGNRPAETRRRFKHRALHAVDVAHLETEPALQSRVATTQSQQLARPWLLQPNDRADPYTKNLHEQFNRLQRRLLRAPDRVMMRITDIYLIGTSGMLYDAATGSILSGHAIGVGQAALNKRRAAMKIQFRAPQRVIAADPSFTYVLADQPGIKVYGHFLLDIMPKIYIAETFLQRPIKLVLRYYFPWMKSMLETLGYGEDQIVVVDEKAVLHFEAIHVPQTLKLGYAVNVGLLQEAWAHYIGRNAALRTAVSASTGGRRLFLSRSKLWFRPRVANEDELFEIARGFGFERISPETLSFVEQVELFASAAFIAGEDGSALHSAIFSARCRAMLCFMRPDRENLWHLAFARAAGMEFHGVKCRTQGEGYAADAAAFETILKIATETRT